MINFIAVLAVSSMLNLTMPEVELESGERVSGCKRYNYARANSRLIETVNNMVASSAYLECSLVYLIDGPKENKALLMRVHKNVRVRAIPLSIAQLVSRKDKLNSKFFCCSNNSISYVEGDHNIVLTIKGKLSDNSYLLWVVDEISTASYRAYFPVVLIDDGIELKLKPLYSSGY